MENKSPHPSCLVCASPLFLDIFVCDSYKLSGILTSLNITLKSWILSHFITVNHIAISGCPALNVSECEPKDTKGFRDKKGNSCLWKATCEVDCRGEKRLFQTHNLAKWYRRLEKVLLLSTRCSFAAGNMCSLTSSHSICHLISAGGVKGSRAGSVHQWSEYTTAHSPHC